MESNILNPKYKELKAIEMYRNNYTGMNYHKEHRNNWKKSLISIFAIAVLLTSVGVPVYGGIMAMENNAVPYEFGSNFVGTTATPVNIGAHGDLIAFEILHWGAIPTARDIGGMIASALIGLGITSILSASEITTISIDIMIYIMEDGTSVTVVDMAIESTALVSPPIAVAIGAAIIAA